MTLPAEWVTAARRAVLDCYPMADLDNPGIGFGWHTILRAVEAAAPLIAAAERARLTQPLEKTAGILKSQVAAAIEAYWQGDGETELEDAVMAVVGPVLEMAAAAERDRIRQHAEYWRQEHWDAGDSFAAGAFARVVRYLDGLLTDTGPGEIIGYGIAGKMYHPADVTIVRLERP